MERLSTALANRPDMLFAHAKCAAEDVEAYPSETGI
jgi:hypothetical protein